MQTLLIVGGTGGQGSEIVRVLSSTSQYKILVLTRDTCSASAQALTAMPHVELIPSNAQHGYDLAAFSAAAEKSDLAFINTDGFALGEQAETYWGIRLFELAQRAGVKHIVYSGLDYIGKKSNYEPSLYVGHYEGKARVSEFIKAQPKSPMAWTIITSGPYMEMLSHSFEAPIKDDQGTYRFELPLGDGAVPYIHLTDFARYVNWAFTNPTESNGLNLEIATAHVSGQELAKAFSASTGNRAKYVDTPIDQWLARGFKDLPFGTDTKVGFRGSNTAPGLVQTFGENFTNWWNLYKASAGNTGLIQRDYDLLDKILPERVKSVEEWMRLVGYTGETKTILRNERK